MTAFMQLSQWLQAHVFWMIFLHAVLYIGLYWGWGFYVSYSVRRRRLASVLEKTVLDRRLWLVGVLVLMDVFLLSRWFV